VAGRLEELAYSLSLRALAQQENVVEELRARTGALLTAAAVVTSFLGARALDRPNDHWLALVGLGLAILSILLAVYVLAPKSDLDFALSGPAVYEHFATEDAELAEVHRTLTYWNQDAWESNQGVIDGLVAAFRWACLALVLAVAIWSFQLALD
jgi:hypothetical protein